MSNLSVTLDTSELEQYFTDAPRKIFNAQRSAIRTTITFVDKELKKRMAAATNLPSTVFKTYRVKKRSSDTSGSVWLGMRAVKAAYAGRLKQEDYGASAGRYYFDGGFVATMRNGRSSIFKRKNARRLPIIEQEIDLPMAPQIVSDVYALAETELQARYIAKLQAELAR